MKIVSFKFTEKKGEGQDAILYASVEVVTGSMFWKKRARKIIFKNWGDLYWRFLDNGEFTPGRDVESLERAVLAQERLKE